MLDHKSERGEKSAISPRHFGFTMVEMLVVLAITFVLGSLLIGSVSKLSARSQSINCVQNLKQLYVVTAAYMQDHQLRYPLHLHAKNETAQGAWFFPLTGFKDPNGNGGTYDKSYITHPGYRSAPFRTRPTPFFCPTNDARSGGAVGWTTYAINFQIIGQSAAALEQPKILFVDSYQKADPPATWYFSKGSLPNNGKAWNYTDSLHDTCLNAIFTDGHAESLNVKAPPVNAQDCGQIKAAYF